MTQATARALHPASQPDTGRAIAVYATAPQSADLPAGEYVRAVRNVARWSERHGCQGLLIGADHRPVDAWPVAAAVVAETDVLAPLVTVHPTYFHPYAVAGMVATLGHLHGRRVALHVTACARRQEARVLDDRTPRDRRYDRLVEYTRLVKRLLNGDRVSVDGEFYTVRDLKLAPPLEPALTPDIFVSGDDGGTLLAAAQLDAIAIGYPDGPGIEPVVPADAPVSTAIRVGIVARDDPDLAWGIALRRFPPDDGVSHEGPYWLVPYEHYRTSCPYLVGSYDQIVVELLRSLRAGVRTYLLDVPVDEEDLFHARAVFERASRALTLHA